MDNKVAIIEVIEGLLTLLYNEQETHTSPLLQATTHYTILYAPWRELVFKVMVKDKLEKYPNEFICDLCSVTSEWPNQVGHYLIKLAASSNVHRRTVFQLLHSYKDGTQSIRWLVLLFLIIPDLEEWDKILNIDYFGEVGRRQRNIDYFREIGRRQRNVDDWQFPAWKRLIRCVHQRNKIDEWARLIGALGETHKTEGAATLKELWLYKELSGERLREAILDQLDGLYDAGIEGAEEILEQLSTNMDEDNDELVA